MGAICASNKDMKIENKKELNIFIDQKSLKELAITLQYTFDGILADTYFFESNFYHTSIESLCITLNYVNQNQKNNVNDTSKKRTILLTQRMKYKNIKVKQFKFLFILPQEIRNTLNSMQYYNIGSVNYENLSRDLNSIYNLMTEFNYLDYESIYSCFLIKNMPSLNYRTVCFITPTESVSNDFILKIVLYGLNFVKDYQLNFKEDSNLKEKIKAYFKKLKAGAQVLINKFHHGLIFPLIDISLLSLTNLIFLQSMDYLQKKLHTLKKRHKKIILTLNVKLKAPEDINLIFKLLKDLEGMDNLTIIVNIISEFIVNNLLKGKYFDTNFNEFFNVNKEKFKNFNIIISHSENVIRENFNSKIDYYLFILLHIIFKKTSKCFIFKKLFNKDIVKSLSKFLLYNKKK